MLFYLTLNALVLCQQLPLFPSAKEKRVLEQEPFSGRYRFYWSLTYLLCIKFNMTSVFTVRILQCNFIQKDLNENNEITINRKCSTLCLLQGHQDKPHAYGMQ